MRFCYVILHYKTANDTIDCINSINQQNEKCDIVVVDNASKNGSIEKLEDIFASQPNITIIKNEDNLGFAAGNNVGYAYARNILKADFIAVSNNDIIVETPNFVTKIQNIYEKTRFAVLGPDIESLKDHGHQNPAGRMLLNEKETVKEIWRYRLLLFLSKIHLYDLLKKKRGASNSQLSQDSTELLESHIEIADVILHGAFIIFSPEYIRKEKFGFRPGTFLYMEESILFRYCKEKGYMTLFSPAVKVFHKEDSSTNSMFIRDKNKREFIFRNMIKSLKVYLEVVHISNKKDSQE